MADETASNGGENQLVDYALPDSEGNFRVKVICLGDSAVGKSNNLQNFPEFLKIMESFDELIHMYQLVERFLIDGYQPHQLSTYALNLFRYKTTIDDEAVVVDFWDTAGQERFNSMHPSYYHQAHACILVFDIMRKITYKNLLNWYKELRDYRPEIPCLCAANKIDVEYEVTKKSFQFPKKHGMPFYFVSASDGTNVVKLFRDAIKYAVQYKKNPTDFVDEVLQELENFGPDEHFGDGNQVAN